MIIILMGVSGSGKTTIGKLLSKKLNWEFIEGDHLHSKKNIEKMKNDTPLTDTDRMPWLLSLKEFITKALEKNQNLVIACSALKKSYRKMLEVSDEVKFVYLKGSFETIKKRIEKRKNHFFDADLLQSQFNALEEPKDSFTVSIKDSPQAITDKIISALGNI